MSNLTQQIQEDWTNRNEIEKVSLSILQIAEFLNKFGMSPPLHDDDDDDEIFLLPIMVNNLLY